MWGQIITFQTTKADQNMLCHGPLAFQCMCVMFGKQGPVCPCRNSSNKITLLVREMPPQKKIIATFRLAVHGDKGNKS